MKRLVHALQFLTILPVRWPGQVAEADIAACTNAFPLVGLIQALLLMATAWLGSLIYSPEVGAALVLMVHVLVSGGFHLDGLADTFDGFAKQGDREGKLLAMRDSASGPIGVIAIVLALLLKWLLFKDLLAASLPFFCLAMLFMAVTAKWAMVAAMHHGRSARPDGLGRIFIDHTGFAAFALATGLTMTLCVLGVFVLSPGRVETGGVVGVALGMATLYLWSLFFLRLCSRQFGGLTGDTLGALAELTELLSLFMALAWLGAVTK